MNTLIRLKRIIKNSLENSLINYVLLVTVFIIGTITGAILLKWITNETSLMLIRLSSSYGNNSLRGIEHFRSSIIFNYLFMTIIFILGLLNVGFLSSILIFSRGCLLGLTVGYLTINQGVKGFIISVFSIYPQYIVYLPCLIIAGVLSILIDRRTNMISMRRNKSIKIYLSEYLVLFILLLGLMTIACIYEGFISPLFFN